MSLVVLVPLGSAPEAHLECDLRAVDLPGVSQVQPLVGHLHLPAVTNGLVEDAELVADAVADGWDLQRRKRVHVAGGQPPEPSVAQARLFLLIEQRVEVALQLLHGLTGLVEHTKVQEVVAEVRAQEELSGEVAHRPGPGRVVGLARADPAIHQSIPDGVGQGEVAVVEGRHLRESPEGEAEVVLVRVLEGLDAQAGANVVTRGATSSAALTHVPSSLHGVSRPTSTADSAHYPPRSGGH